MVTQRFASVPDYIASFPTATQAKLKQVRKAIRDAVPDAVESIRYHIPTYTIGEWKLYFSGYKAHISLHGAVEVARPELGDQMAEYEASGRGTLKFPLDQPIPAKLIAGIARAGIAATRAPKRVPKRVVKRAAKGPAKKARPKKRGTPPSRAGR